mgnify:FL=1
MEKFNIKKMYGYHRIIIYLVMQLSIFIVLLGITLYLKTIDLSKVNNKEKFNEGFIIFIVLDVISAIVFLTSIAIYLYWFLPFKNADGEIITVKITEKTIGDIMYCTIESNEFNNTIVKIRFVSTRYIHFFPFYKIGDYVECFIREKDLSNPKVVVLYK